MENLDLFTNGRPSSELEYASALIKAEYWLVTNSIHMFIHVAHSHNTIIQYYSATILISDYCTVCTCSHVLENHILVLFCLCTVWGVTTAPFGGFV